MKFILIALKKDTRYRKKISEIKLGISDKRKIMKY